MNHLCHVWMSQALIMSHMNESWHTRMSHGTHGWVMAHTNESCPIWTSHVAHEWVMDQFCHIWMSHALIKSRMNESCINSVTHEWVMDQLCHIWMSHACGKSCALALKDLEGPELRSVSDLNSKPLKLMGWQVWLQQIEKFSIHELWMRHTCAVRFVAQICNTVYF